MASQSHSAEPGTADPSRQAGIAVGIATGALTMTIFGFIWLGWGFSATKIFPVTGWIVLYLAFLILLAACIQALRKGKAKMKALAVQPDDFWDRNGRRFGVISALEGAGCVLVVVLANIFHRLDLLPAGISLVVGLHFLPLAGLFRFRGYYVVGIAIIVGDVLSCALFRADVITLSVGLTTGTILWVTSIDGLRRSRKFLGGIAPNQER
jgi:hypothetical protein